MGDSRAIASVNGNVDVLSLDHKPSNETEIERIRAAGGWVEFNRVNGNLALSRALGDFGFKKNLKKRPEEQIVTGELRNLLKIFLHLFSSPDHQSEYWYWISSRVIMCACQILRRNIPLHIWHKMNEFIVIDLYELYSKEIIF